MKFNHPCPKCGSTSIERFESVRADGPLAVGHVLAGVFAVFPQFEAYVCQKRGLTEFYRR